MVKFEFNSLFLLVRSAKIQKKQELIPFFLDFMLKLLKIRRYKK
ncbi:hypothetical protein C2W59_03556 [Bacillus pumilus]|nr:hypothetical protein C2W59_03556 [Bacillus pumilus]